MSDYSELKRLVAQGSLPPIVSALIAEIERLKNHAQSMIDQTEPLVPLEGHPGWSRRITIDELQAEVAELRKNSDRYLWLRNKASVEDWEFLSHRGGNCVDQNIDCAIALYDPEQIAMAISEEKSRGISKRGRDAIVDSMSELPQPLRCVPQDWAAVDFNAEQLNKVLAGKRFTMPEGQTREQFRAWMLGNAGTLSGAVRLKLELEKLDAENVALRDGLVKIIEMNRQHAEDQYGDPEKAESWSCVTVAREALNKEKHNE